VVHRNAPLSELGRLRLARAIVDQGWSEARAAERFQVSRPTAHRWAQRYRDQGAAGMVDRSSRPHHSPRRTRAPVVRKIVRLRWKQRLGPAQIAPRSAWPPRPCMPCWSAAGSAASGTWTGPPASRSAATNTPSRRPGPYRCQEAGQHPRWGGHRFLGRAAGGHNRQADRSSGHHSRYRNPLHGHGFIQAAVDDHSRLAYAEIHPDETRETAAAFLQRAQAWFADRGVGSSGC
jgi:hypothetical protein